MIWMAVSSKSCVCLLHRTSPSLVAKNVISLLLVLTICWCLCVKSTLVARRCLVCPVYSLGQTLLAFSLLHFVLQGQTCLLLQVFLNFLLLHCNPLWWKWHLFWVLVLEDLIGLHTAVQLQLLWHQWLGHRLGLLWHWMVCLGIEQRSFCHFWDCNQLPHFGLFCWLWGLLHFL